MAYDCATDWSALPAEELSTPWSEMRDGIYRAASMTIDVYTRLEVARELVLIADNDIVIDGMLLFVPGPPPSWLQPAPPPLRLAIVSLNGKVTVGRCGSIGVRERARDGDDVVDRVGPFDATGDRGADGGRVLISAAEIDILGRVYGQVGGHGGRGEADAATQPADLGVRLLNALRTPFERPAEARGGDGGRGGDIWLCARRHVLVADGAHVEGGAGGAAGAARAVAARGGRARARGGRAGRGGDVVIRGAGGAVSLSVDGIVVGGEGGSGGATGSHAVARGGASTNLAGGTAAAEGGRAGRGGDVELIDVVVDRQFVILGGSGGSGGLAAAFGGSGGAWAQPPAFGFEFGEGAAGGDALAWGGEGGRGGDSTAPGARGPKGHGGDAEATGGSGGQALAAATTAAGGLSGRSEALGGPNGDNSAHAAGVVFGSVPATGGAGGAALAARQPGVR